MVSTVGLLTVESHRAHVVQGRHYHVLLNGEDVTRRCREANDRKGYVVLYKLRDGHRYVENWAAAVEKLHGDVQIVEGEPFA